MPMTKKEQSLLKDLQNEEKLCAEKYSKAAEAACDPALKTMLGQIAKAEQNHYDTVTDMLAGKVPAPAWRTCWPPRSTWRGSTTPRCSSSAMRKAARCSAASSSRSSTTANSWRITCRPTACTADKNRQRVPRHAAGPFFAPAVLAGAYANGGASGILIIKPKAPGFAGRGAGRNEHGSDVF